jgi:hypothetical protein
MAAKVTVALQGVYPAFFALGGVAASTLLLGRAFAHMNADAKAALIDASSGTRLLNVLVLGLFFGLVLWRPPIGWIFLACAYLVLGARSIFRLRRLDLPRRAARLILIGNVCAVVGVAACAFLFAVRTLRGAV